MSDLVTIELEKNDEEYYARFIRITQGDNVALVFFDEAERDSSWEWARRLAAGITEDTE